MEGFSAAGMVGAVGLWAGAAGAAWACSREENKSTGKSACATRLWNALCAGEGACGPLVRNNLKDNRIVQLRILLRQRCGHFNFQTVRDGWSDPGLALDKLRDGCQRNAVKPESESGIGYGESGEDGGAAGVLRPRLYAQAKPGGNNKASRQFLHLDVGALRAAGVGDGSQIQAALAGCPAGQGGAVRRADEIH
jgi:hypothetical protein